MSVFDLGSGSGAGGPGAGGRDPLAGEIRCSRKGCRATAQWGLLWNNPRLHAPERRKVWLACLEHREWLEQYLRSRGLYKETLPVAELPADAG